MCAGICCSDEARVGGRRAKERGSAMREVYGVSFRDEKGLFVRFFMLKGRKY